MVKTALLISNMPWTGLGQTNRQAWALSLASRVEFDSVLYLENLGFSPIPRGVDAVLAHPKISVLHSWNVAPKAGRPRNRLARVVNSLLTQVILRRVLRRRGAHSFDLVVTFDPLSDHLFSRVPGALKIYDCLDLYEEQPQFGQSGSTRRTIRATEANVARAADQVTVSAPGLVSRFEALGLKPLFFPGATMPLPISRSQPDDSRALPLRRAVYVGALDDYKVDFGVFDRLLDLDQSLEIQIIGRVEMGSNHHALTKILSNNRVEYRPPVDRDQLHAMLRDADFGIVAMRPNRYSDHSFPLKFWDYLAAGVPVLAVNSVSLTAMPIGAVNVANSREIGLETLQLLRAEKSNSEMLQSFASQNAAPRRIAKILDSVSEHSVRGVR